MSARKPSKENDGKLTEENLKSLEKSSKDYKVSSNSFDRNHGLRAAVWKKTGAPPLEMPPASIMGPPATGYRSPRPSISASMAGPNPLYDGRDEFDEEKPEVKKVKRKHVMAAPWERDEVKTAGKKGQDDRPRRNPALVPAGEETQFDDLTVSVLPSNASSSTHQIKYYDPSKSKKKEIDSKPAVQDATALALEKKKAELKLLEKQMANLNKDISKSESRHEDDKKRNDESRKGDDKNNSQRKERDSKDDRKREKYKDLRTEKDNDRKNHSSNIKNEVEDSKRRDNKEDSKRNEEGKAKGKDEAKRIEEAKKIAKEKEDEKNIIRQSPWDRDEVVTRGKRGADKDSGVNSLKKDFVRESPWERDEVVTRGKKSVEKEVVENKDKVSEHVDRKESLKEKENKEKESRSNKEREKFYGKELIKEAWAESKDVNRDVRSIMSGPSVLSNRMAPSIAPGNQKIQINIPSIEGRFENLKRAIEKASVVALNDLPKFERLSLTREERVVAASKNVLFGAAADLVKLRKVDRKNKGGAIQRLHESDLTLTIHEFLDLINFFRMPGQAKLEEHEIQDMYDSCKGIIPLLYNRLFEPKIPAIDIRFDSMKRGIEHASLAAFEELPKSQPRLERVNAAAKKVLFGTAALVIRRRKDSKGENVFKASDKLKESDLILNLAEFLYLSNYFRQSGQSKINEGQIRDMFDACKGDIALLYSLLFQPKEEEVTVNKFGFLKDKRKPQRPEFQTKPFDSRGGGVRTLTALRPEEVPERIKYRQCQTPVQPPRDWDPKEMVRSAQLPNKKLSLDYVAGFKDDNSTTSMYATTDGEIVFYSAAVGIVMDPVANTQRFFVHHTDDISFITLHPSGNIVATGQVAKKPFIYVWSTKSMEILAKVGYIPTSGPKYQSSTNENSMQQLYYDRGIGGMAFSSSGKYLVAFGMDDHHSIAVWDWAAGTLISENVAQSGLPEDLFDIIPSPPSWDEEAGKEKKFTFCTTGVGHLKFWTFDPNSKDGPSLTYSSAIYGRDAKPPKLTKSLTYIDSAHAKIVLSGGDNGYIYMWNATTHNLIKSWFAHRGSIFSLAAPIGIDTFFSGGDDGKVIQWDPVGAVAKKKNASSIGADSYMAPPSETVGALTYEKTRTLDLSGRVKETSGEKPTITEIREKEKSITFKPAALLGPGEVKGPTPVSEVVPPRSWSAIGSLYAIKGNLQDRIKKREQEKSDKLYPMPSKEGRSLDKAVEKTTNSTAAESSTNVTLLIGTDQGGIILFDGLAGKVTTVLQAHFNSLWGLCPHPTNSKVFATAGEDMNLLIWNAEDKKIIKNKKLQAPARCVDISPDGRRIVVGFLNGSFIVYSTSGDMRAVAQHQHCKEYISVVRFSPMGEKLAVGSGDDYIDLYNAKNNDYTHLRRLKGHGAYITHLDWSADGLILQSNCGAYEIIYWDTQSGKQIRSTQDSIESDTVWASYSCILGFPVMGIWSAYSDGTDVNASSLSHDGKYVVTSDDFGYVKLFNAPCVVHDAPYRKFEGHSSHVMNVTFLRNDKYVISVGGNDSSVFFWRVEPEYESLGFDPLGKSKHNIDINTRNWK